ncbi:MAG: hypothetical protein JO223_03505 [Hyphomicrobiales bacterium]|nr:hypothetical protein [Hyphomicrobiales bacterium]
MVDSLIAIVGDASPGRTFDPPMRDPAKAKRAAEEIGEELARRGARLLVYGGPFLEADVVHGFVAGKPAKDRSILMWYSADNQPPPFLEENDHPNLFERRQEKGADWEIAFYRSIVRADGVVLIGGGNATKISGQLAIGTRMPILALREFGGAAAKVWETLSAGEDLPNRADINLMAQPWGVGVAGACVNSLFSQGERRRAIEGAPSPAFSILAGLLFLAALAIVPWVWGQNAIAVWMLFLAPLLAGGAGAAIRPMIDRIRGAQGVAPAVLATVVLGLVAGGIAGVLFVTAQLTADPQLTTNPQNIIPYAQRSIPFAVGVGFVAGLTSDAVFGKLLGLEVVRTAGIANTAPRS